MSTKTIPNPAGAFGLTGDVDGQLVGWYKNNSGAARTQGDVVVIDVTGTQITTTTTVNDKTVLGVVAGHDPSDLSTDLTTWAAGAAVPVIVRGPGRINIGANAPAANDLLTTTATAGVATTNAGAPAANAVVGSIIGVALEAAAAKDANNCIRAYINKM